MRQQQGRANMHCYRIQAKRRSHEIHYSDAIMAQWRLKSPTTRLLTHPFTQPHMKVPRHWPLCAVFTFLAQIASNAENVSNWWRHHETGVLHECDCLASNDHLQIAKEKVRSKNMISRSETHQCYMGHTDFIFQNLSMKMAWSWFVFQIRNINKIERGSICWVKKIALQG